MITAFRQPHYLLSEECPNSGPGSLSKAARRDTNRDNRYKRISWQERSAPLDNKPDANISLPRSIGERFADMTNRLVNRAITIDSKNTPEQTKKPGLVTVMQTFLRNTPLSFLMELIDKLVPVEDKAKAKDLLAETHEALRTISDKALAKRIRLNSETREVSAHKDFRRAVYHIRDLTENHLDLVSKAAQAFTVRANDKFIETFKQCATGEIALAA